ncbi:MAG: hypothetical protein KJ896_03430, partial [Nanoarchaeota archaeon]|nr:hypothetical protein [Nanoarchaeota archaeon]
NSDCGEALTFYHVSIPALASFNINSSTGLINFTPQSGEQGSYNVYVYCSKSGFPANSTIFTLNVLNPTVGPLNFTGSLNVDNESVNLNWTSVSGASSYTIYHSSNISSIMNLNVSSVPGDVSSVTGLSDLNWTDTNASDVQRRYYTVSATVSGNETLTSDRPVGKFTYYYTTPNSTTYGTLSSNRIVLYLNASYSAEDFLQEIPASLNPTLSKLEKSNTSGEYLTTHVRGLNDGNNFTLEFSEGYQLTVDSEFNHTVVGVVAMTPYNLSYDVPFSSQYGTLASNWVGIYDFNNTYTAESFLQEIPAYLNSTISRLEKSNASGEYLTTHVRGLNDGNNFTMSLGTGYVVTVDAGYNHTLCSECFG